jgi:hypothetical protein
MSLLTHYYIWYRVHGDPGAARHAVDATLADVFIHAGVQGRVLVRRDDPRTWMEVYEHVADTRLFEDELARALARHGAAAYAEGNVRHTEAFVAPPLG